MSGLETTGKLLLVAGGGLAVLGGLLWAPSRLGLGHLPGDIHIEQSGFSLAIPLVSSILLSAVLTILLNVVVWVLLPLIRRGLR